jgi:hypothetical protein
MNFTADELLAWAGLHEGDDWATLVRPSPFRYRVTAAGIDITPDSGVVRPVSRAEVVAFCDTFNARESFTPGDYPESFHKSYLLALIHRFQQGRHDRT